MLLFKTTHVLPLLLQETLKTAHSQILPALQLLQLLLMLEWLYNDGKHLQAIACPKSKLMIYIL